MISIRTRYRPPNLAQVISDAPRNARGPMTESAAVYLLGFRRGIKWYPPRRPLQKYVRTYRLRNAWMINKRGAKTTLSNDTPYAPYVKGDNTQAWMHRGRWLTVSEDAERNMEGMVRAAERALEKYLKQKGL